MASHFRLTKNSLKMLRPICNSLWNGHQGLFYSTQSKQLDITVDNAGIGVISMNKPPVNSLNLDFIQELNQAIKELESSKSCKGFILTSSVPKIFSAGLDIMEMYQGKEDRLRKFWFSLQQLWIDLYGSKLASVASITGHSPAGGCLLAVSCDYRIMVQPQYTIGLNETLLGIVPPFWFQDSFINTVGHREAEMAMNLGKMYPSEEAFKKGLVDKLAASPEEALKDAQNEIQRWIKIPRQAREVTKWQLREPTIQRLLKLRQQDTDNFVSFVLNKGTQKALGMYLEALKKKK